MFNPLLFNIELFYSPYSIFNAITPEVTVIKWLNDPLLYFLKGKIIKLQYLITY